MEILGVRRRENGAILSGMNVQRIEKFRIDIFSDECTFRVEIPCDQLQF